MDLDTFIITVFCIIDDITNDICGSVRLRQRGPAPTLADIEVLTIEVVGEYLGIGQDRAMFEHFRRYHSDLFPALRRITRTSFVRQSANLCGLKSLVWQRLLANIDCDSSTYIVDSFPVAVCQPVRIHRCRRFRGEASFGRDPVSGRTFYGFRIHMMVAWPGVIVSFGIVPANVHDTVVLPQLVSGRTGTVLGDRNYWSPRLRQELTDVRVNLHAPFKHASRDPQPQRSMTLRRIRRRIETVFGQLVDRYGIKRVWARDMWHLSSRLLRKTLSHTIAVMLNQLQGNPPLQISKVVV